MSISKKIILGIATFWPTFYIIIFFLFVLSQFFTAFSIGKFGTAPNVIFKIFPIIFGLHFLTIILMIVLLFTYIRNVFNNKRIAQDKKTLWIIVLFFGNFIAMPIYWYLYIWKEPQKEQLLEQKI